MTTQDRSNWPQWLKEAKIENAQVEITKCGIVIWREGEWRGGVWRGGVWQGGVWQGGEWQGGEWLDSSVNRLMWMLATLGVVFNSKGYARAYRVVNRNYSGCHNRNFVQREGRVDVDYDPSLGTCKPGLHVTNAAIAWRYFGIDTTRRLFTVRFHRDDVIDCDGEKIRLKGGWCKEIPVPWAK